MFGSCFLKLLLIIVFDNTENNILVFSKSTPCYLNLVFSVFFVFFITTKWKPNVFLFFRTKKQFSKTLTKCALNVFFVLKTILKNDF